MMVSQSWAKLSKAVCLTTSAAANTYSVRHNVCIFGFYAKYTVFRLFFALQILTAPLETKQGFIYDTSLWNYWITLAGWELKFLIMEGITYVAQSFPESPGKWGSPFNGNQNTMSSKSYEEYWLVGSSIVEVKEQEKSWKALKIEGLHSGSQNARNPLNKRNDTRWRSILTTCFAY